MECVHKSTFGLSFVGRFVLFQSVLYQRFQCTANHEKSYGDSSIINKIQSNRNWVARPALYS